MYFSDPADKQHVLFALESAMETAMKDGDFVKAKYIKTLIVKEHLATKDNAIEKEAELKALLMKAKAQDAAYQEAKVKALIKAHVEKLGGLGPKPVTYAIGEDPGLAGGSWTGFKTAEQIEEEHSMAGASIQKALSVLGGGFKLASQTAHPRLIVALDGMEKEGKTHFAMTAPGPIAYQGMDIGTEGVVDKFLGHKEVHIAEYGYKVAKGDTPAQVIDKVSPVVDKFLTDYRDIMIPGLTSGKIKTGIWDTGSDLWAFLRLARLGKLTQVMPHNYVQVNSEYQQLIREVYETKGNLIILHKLKAEWKDNAAGKGSKTGNYERDGFQGTGFLVQVNATAWREKPNGDFHITVRDCRQNPAIAGLDLAGEMATFPFLGTFVYPETTLQDWE